MFYLKFNYSFKKIVYDTSNLPTGLLLVDLYKPVVNNIIPIKFKSK